MTEPRPMEASPSDETLSRRPNEAPEGPLKARMQDSPDGPISRRRGESPEGPLSKRSGEPPEGPLSKRMGEKPEGPLSKRMSDQPRADWPRRGSEPPPAESPPSRRVSEPPPSLAPFSMRMFEQPFSDAPMSEAPISQAPLSLRIARISGEAGPGYRLREDEDALLISLDEAPTKRCRAIRISLATVWFLADSETEYKRDAPVRVRLLGKEYEIGPLLAQIVSIDPAGHDKGPLIGLQLIGVPLPVGRQIIALIHGLVRAGLAEPARSLSMVQEHIDAPERIRSLMNTLIAAGGEGVLQGLTAPVKAERVEGQGEERILWKGPLEWGAPPYVVDMIGYNSIHRLRVPSVQIEGDQAVTPLPTAIERVRHRWFRRVAVRTPVTAGYRHPLWPELQVSKRKVKDVSYAGICFETSLSDDLAFPGLELSELIVEREGEPPIRLRGQVRFVSFGKNGEPSLCGMSVSPRSPDDERRWMALVSQELHARTQSGTEMPEPVWSLFESSGYFRLSGKSPEAFEPLKTSFMNFGKRVAAAPQLICQAVWPSSRGIEASLSLLKAYFGTWMTHQLAKRPGRAPGDTDPRMILRDIYVRAMEHPQVDPDFRWMIASLDATVSWSRVAHAEFAQRHENTGLAMVRPFRLMEGSCADRTATPDGTIEVGLATSDEVDHFLGFLTRVRPRCYLEALDFTPDLYDMLMVTKMWREVGLLRSRDILVARRNGRPVAVAVVEVGETGTNLFRLLDGVRLFTLERGGGEAYAQLLDGARAWYTEKGKTTFILFHEDIDDDPYIAGSKLRSLGDGNFWIISALLVPEFLEHIYELTTPRRVRREKTAK